MITHKHQLKLWTLTEFGQILVLLTLTAWVHRSLLNASFLLYDDESVVIGNPLVHSGSWQQIFSSFTAGLYHPLTTLSWVVEARWFGFNPTIFHGTNILLHLVATFLLFSLARRLWQGRLLAAPIILAALFAMHPLHVESVAWITERKDLLCQVFYLTALYWQAGRPPTQSPTLFRWYGVFAATLCALLAKPMAITLPLNLLLIDLYLDWPQWDRRRIFEKLPHFLCALIIGIVTVIGQIQARGESPWSDGFGAGLLRGAEFFGFFLWKSVLPLNLSVIYDPNIISSSRTFIFIIIACFSLFTIAYFSLREWRRDAIFGFLFLLISAAPVMRLVQFGDESTFNDRSFYLPGIGFLWAITALTTTLPKNLTFARVLSKMILICWLPIIGWYAIATQARCLDWKDDETLMKSTIRQFPHLAKPHLYLAQFYARSGRHSDAAASYRHALERSTSDPIIQAGLAYSLYLAGARSDAEQVLNNALQGTTHDAEVLYTAGIMRLETGELKAGRDFLTRALKAPSVLPEPYRSVQRARIQNTLAVGFLREGAHLEALEYVNQALSAAGSLMPEAHYNQGLILKALARPNDALQAMQRALALAPKEADMQGEIAILYWELGEREHALAAVKSAIELAPMDTRNHCNNLFFLEKSGFLDRLAKARETLVKIAPTASCLRSFLDQPVAP